MMERHANVYPPELLDCNPGAGWVLIKPDEKTNLTTGGIILPDGDENMSALRTGLVVKVGCGLKLDSGLYTDQPCEPGNTVLYTDSGAALVHVQGVQHMLVRFLAILGGAKPAERRFVKPTPALELVYPSPDMPTNGAPRPIR